MGNVKVGLGIKFGAKSKPTTDNCEEFCRVKLESRKQRDKIVGFIIKKDCLDQFNQEIATLDANLLDDHAIPATTTIKQVDLDEQLYRKIIKLKFNGSKYIIPTCAKVHYFNPKDIPTEKTADKYLRVKLIDAYLIISKESFQKELNDLKEKLLNRWISATYGPKNDLDLSIYNKITKEKLVT